MMFPEPCIVHMQSYDDHCDACAAEIGAINQQQSDTNIETAKIVHALELEGYEVDEGVHIAVKLDTLIESLTGKNPKGRAKFDATVAVNLLGEMVRQQAQAARETLLS
jgi:cobyric acid synthase